MTRVLNSFKVRYGNKILDYRLGEDLDLSKIQDFFQKKYQVQKIWKNGRHVLGILIKDRKTYFLKVATSEGMSVVTKNEYNWNNYFNQYFPKNLPYCVPQNYDSGLYEDKLFYLITDYFAGKLLCENRFLKDSNHLNEDMPQIIDLSEAIQKLPKIKFSDEQDDESDYQARFVSKARGWFADIPVDIVKKYNINTLLEMVEKGVDKLLEYPRHGDFAPWHIIKMDDGRLGLIDGEHALSGSVEYYDICYFIQRVFGVLKNKSLAAKIYLELLKRNYNKKKLQTVFAARAIGGFLDESLTGKPNYIIAYNFKTWVENI